MDPHNDTHLKGCLWSAFALFISVQGGRPGALWVIIRSGCSMGVFWPNIIIKLGILKTWMGSLKQFTPIWWRLTVCFLKHFSNMVTKWGEQRDVSGWGELITSASTIALGGLWQSAEDALCVAWGLLRGTKADFPHTFSRAPCTSNASSNAASKMPGTVLN